MKGEGGKWVGESGMRSKAMKVSGGIKCSSSASECTGESSGNQ